MELKINASGIRLKSFIISIIIIIIKCLFSRYVKCMLSVRECKTFPPNLVK
jgi:hypothetical protein